MNYFEIFKMSFGKFALVFFDDLEKPENLIYFESITTEEVGQILGGN